MMNDLLPADEELYAAWKATYDQRRFTDEALAARIYERARLAYERAYDELGPLKTQQILRIVRVAHYGE